MVFEKVDLEYTDNHHELKEKNHGYRAEGQCLSQNPWPLDITGVVFQQLAATVHQETGNVTLQGIPEHSRAPGVPRSAVSVTLRLPLAHFSNCRLAVPRAQSIACQAIRSWFEKLRWNTPWGRREGRRTDSSRPTFSGGLLLKVTVRCSRLRPGASPGPILRMA